MKNQFMTTGIFTILAIISGCSLYQKPVVPAENIPSHFKYHIQKSSAHLKKEWWKSFRDPHLNTLVRTAIKHNYDYKIALKNIEIAKTYISQYQSGLFPQLNLNYSLSRQKSLSVFSPSTSNLTSGFTSPGNLFNLQQLYASVNYEIDVWNQIGNSIKQAKSDTLASIAASDVIKLTLINSVITTYFQIQTLNENIINLTRQYDVTSQLFHVNNTQYRGKLIDASPLVDNKNQLVNIKININNAKKQKEVLTNTLAYLVGEYPENFHLHLSKPLQPARLSKIIPKGIPSEVLINRPDIKQAYFQVLSFGYIEKQTFANFFPSFNITADYGFASSSFSHFLTHQKAFWDYGLLTVLPVFDYQLRMSQYQRAKYQFESSILSYKSAIMNAFQEVDNALTSYQHDNQSLSATESAILNSKQKLDLSSAQYQSGYGDYSTYLSNQLALLQNRYTSDNQRLAVIVDIVQVYKTLGIGLG